MNEELIELIAEAIWQKRPDTQNKPYPRKTSQQRKNYGHNPIAACDLCLLYAETALKVLTEAIWLDEIILIEGKDGTHTDKAANITEVTDLN